MDLRARRIHGWLAAIFLASASLILHAQVPDAGQVLRDQQSTTPRTVPKAPIDEPEIVRPSLPDTGGTSVLVRSIRFSGTNGLATDAELTAQVKDAIDQELDFAQLERLTDRITQYLRREGWFLARAYLPQQDVTAGHIEIAILGGRIEGGTDGSGIQIDATQGRLSEERVRKTLSQSFSSSGSDALRRRDLERGLLLLDDLPGVSAQASLERGTVPNTTAVSVHLAESAVLPGTLFADSYGNRYTGTARIGGQVALNNPLHTGDELTLGLSAADRLKLGRLGYSLPIGYRGLRADAGFTALKYDIGEELSALNAEGKAQTLNAGLTYPFIRSRLFNFSGSLTYDYKALKDEALGSAAHDKRVGEWSLGLNSDHLDGLWGGGLTNVQLGATFGDLNLSRVASDARTDELTARTQGHFTRINYGVSRLQKVASRVSLFVSGSGQRASKNLDSVEEFMLGGPGGIRVYPVGEGSGDEGWLANVELRYDVPNFSLGALQLVSFLDTGHVTLDHDTWGPAGNAENTHDYRLTGTGLGLNFSGHRYAVRAAWATKVGDNAGRSLQGDDVDGRHHGSRFWLQALYAF